MFQNIFSFNGRIRRTEYGISAIIYGILVLVVNQGLESAPNASFMALVYVPLLWFQIAQNTKRCHDLGNSGWFQIIPLYVFWLLFQDSKIGRNMYGLNPKGIGNPQIETQISDV